MLVRDAWQLRRHDQEHRHVVELESATTTSRGNMRRLPENLTNRRFLFTHTVSELIYLVMLKAGCTEGE